MSYIIIYLVLILLYNYVSWIEFTCLFPRILRAALWSSYRKWSQTARPCPWFVEPFWDMPAGFWAHPQGSDLQHRRSPCRWPACTVWSDRCISLYSPRLSGQRSGGNYWSLYHHFTSVNKETSQCWEHCIRRNGEIKCFNIYSVTNLSKIQINGST